jgi:uncharacterized protein YyaL (SSP411 family)
MPNRLIAETSPYLLQHADNPVDWYPWGGEALQKAEVEDKPIFLSVGYSACHWCHVMAHESFEDGHVAAILNEHFVNVKVDREERPDLDRIYMSAVQALTGRGGWPMSVFLTPDGRPFYGGTYFPPVRRYGMPSFTDVLLAVADAWQNRRQELIQGGQQLVDAVERQMAIAQAGEDGRLRTETLASAVRQIQGSFDETHGGWGGAPKFPQPMVLEFLLRYHHRTGDAQALHMVTRTLDAMARGGMYDQLGGGFHRYSVDEHWTTPHFEKMLYDNAQLARVYLHAWQVTGEPFYRAVVEETLDYVVREMTYVGACANDQQLRPGPQLPSKAACSGSLAGVQMLRPQHLPSSSSEAGTAGFYSAQDADSEGEEGKFFVWTPDEIRGVLGDQANRFIEAYGVTERGNFEGKNILELKGSLEEREALAGARRKLFQVREDRVYPGRDDKVLTSWNGLMLAALAEAARMLGRDDYRQVAEQNAEFILTELKTSEGRLYHTWKACPEQGRGGGVAKVNGYLEDYTHLVEGLLELYQTTFDVRWYAAAHELAETMIVHFRAAGVQLAQARQLPSDSASLGGGIAGFYDTSDDHETLVVRPRELQDNAVPSGNAMAALVLSRLAGLAVEPRYEELARRSLRAMQPMLARYPLGFAQWLIALDYVLAHPREVAIVGDPGAADTLALQDVCRAGYRPHQVVALGGAGTETDVVPLLRDRDPIDGRAVAYVCVDSVCQRPVTEPDELKELIERASG